MSFNSRSSMFSGHKEEDDDEELSALDAFDDIDNGGNNNSIFSQRSHFLPSSSSATSSSSSLVTQSQPVSHKKSSNPRKAGKKSNQSPKRPRKADDDRLSLFPSPKAPKTSADGQPPTRQPPTRQPPNHKSPTSPLPQQSSSSSSSNSRNMMTGRFNSPLKPSQPPKSSSSSSSSPNFATPSRRRIPGPAGDDFYRTPRGQTPKGGVDSPGGGKDEMADFKKGPWMAMLRELDIPHIVERNGELKMALQSFRYNIRYIERGGYCQKVPKLIVLITEFRRPDHLIFVTVKDPFGKMEGTMRESAVPPPSQSQPKSRPNHLTGSSEGTVYFSNVGRQRAKPPILEPKTPDLSQKRLVHAIQSQELSEEPPMRQIQELPIKHEQSRKWPLQRKEPEPLTSGNSLSKSTSISNPDSNFNVSEFLSGLNDADIFDDSEEFSQRH